MSSYIAVDLDALNKFPAVARAARVTEDEVAGGLVRLWAACFRDKTDRLSKLEVSGYFATEEALIPALVAFGFLESLGDELYRARGASRYLRVAEGRSRGGKAAAAAGNLRRGGAGGRAPAASQLPPSCLPAVPGAAPQLDSSLSPTTDDRLPKLKASAPTPKASAPPRDSDELVKAFQEVLGAQYLWQGAKDGTALARILKAAPMSEVLARWRRGLQAPESSWASCRNVAQLAAKWNDLANSSPAPSREPKPARQL